VVQWEEEGMSFSALLRQETDSIWQEIFRHPMVTGIGNGTLPEAKFRFWLVQDYLYLTDFSRLFALGAAKAPDLETMAWFSQLLHSTLTVEMGGHRDYAARFGVDPVEMGRAEMAPWCRAYTKEMLAAAAGSLGDLVATLLPCMAGYAETGRRLAAQGKPDHPIYREWIEMYASAEFGALADYCASLLDRLAGDADVGEIARWQDIYRTSARYEYLFWQMCWEEQTWPV
jgi:thiaminase (transcriptional activator TenA)